MDGYFPLGTTRARTLKSAISCVGIGLHSGVRTTLALCPADPGTGILFRRTDTGAEIVASYDAVTDTRLCTAIGEGPSRIGTVEHVMAALSGLGVTDVVVEVSGPEVPILDGSAAPFVFLLDCAGLTTRAAPTRAIEVLKTVRVTDGEGPDAAYAEFAPGPLPGLDAEVTIEFGAAAIGRQTRQLPITEDTFRAVLSDSRTFTLAADVARLRAAGLARGGSLANAVVVDGAEILNPGGLRHPDEFVRHKMLDAVGDLALAGAPLKAKFRGHRSGHALNNRLLRALFEDATAWRWIGEASQEGASSAVARFPVAAAPA